MWLVGNRECGVVGCAIGGRLFVCGRGEVSCSGVSCGRSLFGVLNTRRVWPQIYFPRQICKMTEKKIVEKDVISRNFDNHPFLTKDMQTRTSTDQKPGNSYGLNPG